VEHLNHDPLTLIHIILIIIIFIILIFINIIFIILILIIHNIIVLTILILIIIPDHNFNFLHLILHKSPTLIRPNQLRLFPLPATSNPHTHILLLLLPLTLILNLIFQYSPLHSEELYFNRPCFELVVVILGRCSGVSRQQIYVFAGSFDVQFDVAVVFAETTDRFIRLKRGIRLKFCREPMLVVGRLELVEFLGL